MIYYDSNELYHHGILGQRWGKKNGPPYPLSAKDHSASEKKAGWRKSLDSNGELEEKKKAYKQAKKEYSRSFNKAYNRSIAAYSPVKAHREANKERWADASSKAQKYLDAKKEYKNEKQKIKEYQKINREILKKNPNAAVVNPNILDWAKQHKKELLIGAGVVGTAALVAAGAKAYDSYKNKQLADILLNANKVSPVSENKGFDAVSYGKKFVKDSEEANRNRLKLPVNELNGNDKDLQKARELYGEYGGFNSRPEQFMKAWFNADSKRYNPISPEEFARMGNDDGVSIDSGAKLFRMSKGKHGTLRDGFEYVSISEEDRDRYRGFLPQMWNADPFGRIKTTYEATLEAKTKIKAPGKKESIELMEAALKKAFPGHSDDVYRADILKNFYQYQANLIDRDNKLGKSYAKELISHGYNAMIDFNDAGRLSDKPLILINGNEAANVKEIREFSIDETREFFKHIELPKAYEGFNTNEWNKMDSFSRRLYENYLGAYMKGV